MLLINNNVIYRETALAIVCKLPQNTNYANVKLPYCSQDLQKHTRYYYDTTLYTLELVLMLNKKCKS